MDDKMLIKVEVVDRIYPLRIKRSDSRSEETIREAAKRINQAVDKFKQLGMKEKEERDLLAMVGIQFAVKAIEAENQDQLEPLLEGLRELNFLMSSFLEEE